MTLIEVMITLALLAVVMGTFTKFLFAYTEQSTVQELKLQLRENLRNTGRILEREVRNGRSVIASYNAGGVDYYSDGQTLIFTAPVFDNDYPKTLDPLDTTDNDVLIVRREGNDLVMDRFNASGSEYKDYQGRIVIKDLSATDAGGNTNYDFFTYYDDNGSVIDLSGSAPHANIKDAELIEFTLCGSDTYKGTALRECKTLDSRFIWQSYAP